MEFKTLSAVPGAVQFNEALRDLEAEVRPGTPYTENPTGVIAGSRGIFSRRDLDKLRSIERAALAAELRRFFAAESLHPTKHLEQWIETAVPRLISQLENHLYSGGFFYDRVERWVARKARPGNDVRARRLARSVARRAVPIAWREVLAFAEQSQRSQRDITEQHRLAARNFIEEQTAEMPEGRRPTALDLDALAHQLAHRDLVAGLSSADQLRPAASANPALLVALAQYDAWHANQTPSDQNRVTWRMFFAFHWPEILREWSEEQERRALGHKLELENHRKETRAYVEEQVAMMPPEEKPDQAGVEDLTRRLVERDTLGGGCAVHWPAVVWQWRTENAPRLGVARALAQNLTGDELTKSVDAETHLREAVAGELARGEFKAAAGWPWSSDQLEEEERGIPAHAARFVLYLRSRFCPNDAKPDLRRLIDDTEETLKRWVSEWRAKPQQRSPWQRFDSVRAASIVAQVLWLDRVQGEIKRRVASTTALVTTVHAGIGDIWATDTKQRELKLLGPDGSDLAWLAIGSEEDSARLFGVGTTLTFHRLVRHLPQAAWALCRNSGRDQADIIIEGGFSGLADAIGAHSKKAAEEVKRALELGNIMRRRWSDGSEAQGLWTYYATPHAPGRPAQLIITLSPFLRPGYTHKLPEGASKLLVPVVPLPSFVGRERDYAKQAALQWSTLTKLTDGRLETAKEGGVTITPAEWQRMAKRAGLPVSTLPAVLEKWEGEFIERKGGDRWFLANTATYAPARKHLLDQAKMADTQAKRGRASAAKKRSGAKSRSLEPSDTPPVKPEHSPRKAGTLPP